jgi:hypothetical protein
MSKALPACFLAIAVTLAPVPADAQIYKFIKVCMRKWQTAVACIVIEKGVEKIVEKSAEDWLSYYRKSKDAPPAPPLKAPAPPPSPRSPTFGEIARNGTDFRALMKDLDSKVGTAPVKSGKDLVGVLGNRCGLVADSVACSGWRLSPPARRTSRHPRVLFTCDARGLSIPAP